MAYFCRKHRYLAESDSSSHFTKWSPLGRYLAIFAVTRHLVLIVPADQIVNNMREAYERIRLERPGFGIFISGPSKSADIEQALVLGAHGARSGSLFLVGS